MLVACCCAAGGDDVGVEEENARVVGLNWDEREHLVQLRTARRRTGARAVMFAVVELGCGCGGAGERRSVDSKAEKICGQVK